MKKINTKKSNGSFLVKLWFTIKMAIHGLIANPLRSFLTILGVSIGVASVVSLMGIGEGARLAVIDQFENLGKNVIDITSYQKQLNFDPEYSDELIDRVDNLERITPVVKTKADIKWRRLRGEVEVLGVNQEYPEIRDQSLIAGHFFTKEQSDRRIKVAVLGHNIGKKILNGRSPVGKTISINGLNYKIIGVLNKKGENRGENIDNKIVIPYYRALQIQDKRKVETFWAEADSKKGAALSVVQLGRIIKRRLGDFSSKPQSSSNTASQPNPMESSASTNEAKPTNNQESDFMLTDKEDAITITSFNNLIKEADKANRVMTLLLGGIASVSLLVGGLGIMNIMLVSVSERTAEIGVRRAIGATQSDLLLQFILEALFLSIIGAFCGIILGIFGLNLFSNLGFQTAISFKAIRISTVIALLSGLIFGVYPAISASSVPPVEALRN
ncbi:MAG: ABC transporter permease [Bacillota bacterium]